MKTGERSVVREMRFIIYLWGKKVLLKDHTGVFECLT